MSVCEYDDYFADLGAAMASVAASPVAMADLSRVLAEIEHDDSTGVWDE